MRPLSRPLADLLADAARADGGRPLLTFYDDASGERTELSVATTANWVAKTANLLVDGLGHGPGERLAVLLPVHWQAVVAVLAGWRAGLTVQVGVDPAAADVVVATADQLPRALDTGADVVGLSLAPLGAPLADVPPGVIDYASEVLAYGDVAPAAPTPEPALLSPGGAVDAAQLLAVPPAQPQVVLTTRALVDLQTVRQAVVAPLATRGRVVLCRHLDPDRLERRRAVERVTTVLLGHDARTA